MVAAFLFGVAGTAAVLVGIWTKAAATGDRLQARQARTAHALRLTRARAARANRELVIADSSLRELRARLQAQGAALRRAQHSSAARAAALADLSRRTSALVRDARTLAADIEALDASLASSGQSVDPGFLATQVAYLLRAGKLAERDAITAVKATQAAAAR